MGRSARARKSGSSSNARPDRFRFTPERLVLILAASIAGIVLALFVVQAAAVGNVRSRTLPMVARLAPDHPEIVIRTALRDFAVARGLSEASYRRLVRAAPMAPLAAEPLLFHGLYLLGRGQVEEAQSFLEEARRRDPRDRLARLVLLDQYLRRGDARGAAGEVQVLVRLIPDSGPVLVPELARLAVDPETRGTLAQALAGQPMMEILLKSMLDRGADPQQVIELAAGTNMLDGGADRQWKQALMISLVRNGRFGTARRLWAQFHSLPRSEAVGAIHDSDFRGLPGGPPFGWRLREGASGFAEQGRPAGLVAHYYGRQQMGLAEQLLSLSPGRHRLEVEAQGESEAGGGTIAWNIRCHGARNSLVVLGLAGLSDRPSLYRAEFEVPAGCPAQWLRLVGVPAEFPADQTATIRRIRIASR